jgi:hypothetical protein
MTKSQKHYSPWLLLLILFGLYIGFMILDVCIGSILSNWIAGYGITEIRHVDPFIPKVRTVWRLFSFIDPIMIYLIPAVLFVVLIARKPKEWVSLNGTIQWQHVMLVLLIFLAGTPMYCVLGDWNETWNLEPRSEEDKLIMKALMYMPDLGSMLLNLLLFVIIPAITQGLLFRVVLQQLLMRIMPRAPWIAIILTALISSASFFNMRDFIPGCLLGLQVGAIFYITGNFWLSVFCNILVSSLAIALIYLFQIGVTHYDPMAPTNIPWYTAIIGFIITVVLYWYLHKKSPRKIIIPELEDESEINSIGAKS